MGNSKGFWRKALDPDLGPRLPKDRGLRTTENVHDDEVWGPHWSAERHAEAAKLRQQRLDETAAANRNVAKLEEGKKLNEARKAENPESAFQWARFSGGDRKFHITPSGEARPCAATTRPCPYGSEDHFSMASNSGVDPQRAAEWIVERRTVGHDATLAFKLDSVDAENPRAMARQARADTRKRGAHANIIEVEATIHLDKSMKPVTLSRRIGNTYGNRLADHAYWVLDDGYEPNRLVTDNMNEAELQNFITRYMETCNSYLPEYQTELREELSAQIRHLMAVAEGEAAGAQPGSAHHSTVPLDFEGLPGMNEQGELEGMLNYGSSGIEPQHLARPVKTGGRVKEVSFAEGFEVFDNDAGSGTAGWRMVKQSDGWELTVIGSRGDEHLFHVASPEEAESVMGQAYGSYVAQKDERHGRYYGDETLPEGTIEAKKNRMRFVKELLGLEQR